MNTYRDLNIHGLPVLFFLWLVGFFFFFFGYVWENATGGRRGNFGRDRALLLIICHGEMFSLIVVMLFLVQNCLKFGENVELDLNITGVGDQ
jgi:hypothetical protein